MEWNAAKRGLEDLHHLLNALAFSLHVRMDIKVHCSSDIGMTKERTQGLVVAVGFYASRSKCVPEAVNLSWRQLQGVGDPPEIVPESLGIRGGGSSGCYEIAFVPSFPEFMEYFNKHSGYRHLAD